MRMPGRQTPTSAGRLQCAILVSLSTKPPGEEVIGMGHPRYTADEIVDRGRAIYDQQIRQNVRPEDTGRFLIINVDTGDYEVDDDDRAAADRAHARDPDGAFFGMRIGHRSSGTI